MIDKKNYKYGLILFSSLVSNVVFGFYWVWSLITDRQVKDKQLIYGL